MERFETTALLLRQDRMQKRLKVGQDGEHALKLQVEILKRRLAEAEAEKLVLVSAQLEAFANAANHSRASLSRLMDRVEVADRLALVGTLAAGVAHEINNPLTVVMTNLGCLGEAVRELASLSGISQQSLDGVQEQISDTHEAADRIRLIARDLNLFARAPKEEKELIDVRHTIESSLRMAANEIRHRARLVKEYGEMPLVAVNEARLGQVLLNLIVNAAQALPEENDDVNEIRITTRVEGNLAIIEVTDTGGGIAPAIAGRIFDPFFTTKPPGRGTGLGLAISKRIVTAMGGDLTMRSEFRKGTTFKVALPVARDVKLADGAKAVIAPAVTHLRGRILVVDDEEMILHVVRRLLESEHEVVTAISGHEALALCRSGEKFDIILCDLMMPAMSGMELERELLSFAPDQARRMTFVTGGAFTPAAQEFLAHAGRAHINKPFEALDLRANIQRLLAANPPLIQ